MADFPENSVKVFEFADLFEAFDLDAVRSALEASLDPIDTHPGSNTPIPPDVRQLAQDVRAARRELLAFLGNSAATDDVAALREAYESMKRGFADVETSGFGSAHDSLGSVNNHPDLPTLTPSTVELSYSGEISYRAFIQGAPDAEGEPTVVPVTRVICKAYEGDAVPAADIIALNTFMKAGAERKILLDNECLQGLGGLEHLIPAIDAYAKLLPRAVTARIRVLGVEMNLFQRYEQRHTGPRQAVVMPGIFATWTSPPRDITPAQQFAALRSAFAHLALADYLQRAHRVVSSADRDRLARIYLAAIQLVAESGVSPANALRGQIEAHAVRQRRKLAAGLNALGLWDGFVPVLRFSALARAARDAVNELAESAGDALSSLRSAEDLIGQELDLTQERAEEDLRTGIYLSRITLAELGEDKANEQVSMIEDQRRFLAAQSLASLFSGAMQAIADPSKALGTVGGAVETGVNYFARTTELGHQLEMAKLDVGAAEVQNEIAETELYISQRRTEHLAQQLEFLVNRQVDADLYLTLAEMHEKRASRLLEAAVLLAYLAERALAFARGTELPQTIRFDYWADPDPETIPGPEQLSAVARLNAATIALKADLADVTRLGLIMEDDNLQTFQEHISLSEHYPLEFARLLQEGEAHFEYSLYQLSKRFPFSHKCRLYGAAVEVNATGPVGGPRGVLEHTGAFLVRDKGTTISEATRLVPTAAELADALQTQRAEGIGVAAVAGVLYYVLEPDPLVSTLNSPLIPINAPDDLLPDDLRRALEGYAPTGLWRLELHNLDELRVTDITLHFGLIGGVDTGALERRVVELIGEYETELRPPGEPLDKITAFSLRQQFPDTFSDLRTGAATMPLDRSSFPDGLANLQFKGLVGQALDANDRGVEGIRLRFGRTDVDFQLERVTIGGGFTEDLDVGPEIIPPDDRFGVVGPWRIELPDPGQFSQLGDLRLFLIYSYE